MPDLTAQLAWRTATPADEPLLFELFAAAKALEFAPLGLAEQQLQPLLAMQFRARQSGYAAQFPNALDTVLLLSGQDGTEVPVGRHLFERRPEGYRGLDLAVLPEFQNRGIGAWALHQVQQLAALEGVPFHLRVVRANPALRLYERLGFLPTGGDELSYEMEWTAPLGSGTAPSASTLPVPAAEIVCGDITLHRETVIDRIAEFLREIGLRIDFGPVPTGSFLPGIQMIANGLRVSSATLLYPGDLLHEAGHLALMTPERRFAEFPVSADPAEEMGALAWSYAAAIHIGLPPEAVFHQNGYKGQARSLVQNFQSNPQAVGVPLLGFYGLTTIPFPGTPSIFPRMLRWLREDTSPPTEAEEWAPQELCNAH